MKIVNRINIPKDTINQEIISGKPSVYKDLQKRYFRLIFDLVRKMGGDSDGENANDIYSETILVLYEKVKSREIDLSRDGENKIYLKNKNGKKTLLSTYLYEVARRRWLKSTYNPRNKNTTEFIDDYNYEFDNIGEDISNDDIERDEGAINENYDKLSTNCQMVILLRKVCKVKHAEIAEFRGITDGAARNLFANCWKNLMEGTAIQRKETRVRPQISKMNIYDLLEVFLGKIETGVNNWLMGELAEKTYYRQLPHILEKRLGEITSGNQNIDNQIELLKSIISFLDGKQNKNPDLYKQDKESIDYFKKKDSYFEKKYQELAIASRFILLLHHVAHTDKLKIAGFFELEDDISALQRIHECKFDLAEKISKDKITYNELNNNKQHEYSN